MGGFLFKLVAAKVIRQHVFLYIVLVHENDDKWPTVTQVQQFCSGFDNENLVSSFRGSEFLQKCVFFRV